MVHPAAAGAVATGSWSTMWIARNVRTICASQDSLENLPFVRVFLYTETDITLDVEVDHAISVI